MLDKNEASSHKQAIVTVNININQGAQPIIPEIPSVIRVYFGFAASEIPAFLSKIYDVALPVIVNFVFSGKSSHL